MGEIVSLRISILTSLLFSSPLVCGGEYPATIRLHRLPDALANYCFECHDSDSADAEIDLESLESGPINPFFAMRTLEKIQQVVLVEEMPPKKAEQPGKGEREAMLNWVNAQIDQLADTFEDDPGTVVMPRLTNYEYRNVIRDIYRRRGPKCRTISPQRRRGRRGLCQCRIGPGNDDGPS